MLNVESLALRESEIGMPGYPMQGPEFIRIPRDQWAVQQCPLHTFPCRIQIDSSSGNMVCPRTHQPCDHRHEGASRNVYCPNVRRRFRPCAP
ncbi:hypothetical protein IL38_24320 [Actinopolyspora erythraea]|uniref:Uncharacterized protein n=1 Tax=Actinopolyspora erythraea TaxID=414996 RepID=A0ABR4WYK5_9ACTN|nr:hypothetical protein IL38_24320 [Actinopolyspora erythraea]